jgi:hypothetical protein
MTSDGLSMRSHPAKQRQSSAFFMAVASRFDRRRCLDEPRYKLFWEVMAIVASMLIFAALRPSTPAITPGATGQSTRIYLRSEKLGRTDSTARFQPTGVSNAGESQYSMAKDFTDHSKLRSHSIATVQKSEVTHAAQGNLIPTRVVSN